MKHFFRKKVLYNIITILLLVFLLTACGSQNTPDQTATEFLNAFKSGNVEQALDYLAPSQREYLESYLDLADSYLGNGSDAITSLFGANVAKELEKSQFAIDSTEYNGDDNATVTVNMFVDGEFQGQGILEMTKIDGKWYITEMSE